MDRPFFDHFVVAKRGLGARGSDRVAVRDLGPINRPKSLGGNALTELVYMNQPGREIPQPLGAAEEGVKQPQPTAVVLIPSKSLKLGVPTGRPLGGFSRIPRARPRRPVPGTRLPRATSIRCAANIPLIAPYLLQRGPRPAR
jgi:hypothetical protein